MRGVAVDANVFVSFFIDRNAAPAVPAYRVANVDAIRAEMSSGAFGARESTAVAHSCVLSATR